jgi:8-oxo-dGTP pyrophosphatase MutT (NUDIX family)
MDIHASINNIKLYLRSAVIMETDEGYIFEKDYLTGIYFIIGGGIQINESSEEAAKREIFEEIGIKIDKINLKAIIERFFEEGNIKYHGIEFFYETKIFDKIILPKNFYTIKMDEMERMNIKPKIIYDIIKSEKKEIRHIILNG